jgi:hypothetical protein
MIKGSGAPQVQSYQVPRGVAGPSCLRRSGPPGKVSHYRNLRKWPRPDIELLRHRRRRPRRITRTRRTRKKEQEEQEKIR